MVKQEKNIKLAYKKKITVSYKKKRVFSRLYKSFKTPKKFFRFFWHFKKLKKNLFLKKKKINVLHIKIKQNNIFATLTRLNRALVKKFISSELLKIKVTKKRLAFNLFIFFKKLLRKIKKSLKGKIVLILNIPKRLRKKVLKWWLTKKKHLRVQFIIVLIQMKAFNGCRLKKIKRKKRIKHRYFKNII